MALPRIAIFISFIAILIAPAFTKVLLIDGENSTRLFLANLLFAIFFLSKRKIELPSPLKIPLIALSVYFFYKLFNSIAILNYAELIYSSQLTFFFLSSILLLSSLSKKDTFHTLVLAVVLGNILSLLYLGFEIISFGGVQKVTPYQLSSFFSYKNVLSAYLLLSSIIGIYWAFHQRKQFTIFFFVLTLINFYAVYYLESRAVLLAYCCIFFTFIYLQVKKPGLKFIIIFLSLLFISTAVFYIINYTNLSLSSLDSMEERFKLWEKTIQLIQEEFWFGVGAGNWQFNFSRFGVNDIYMLHQSKSSFQSPHNEILWIFSEGGFIGLLSIFLVILSFILINKRYQFTHKSTTQQQLLTAALIGFFPVSFFSFPSERVSILFLYALLIALWQKPLSFSGDKKVLSKSLQFSLAILCLSSFLISAFRINGEYHTKEMVIAQKNNQAQKVLFHAKKAKSIFYNTDSRSTPLSSYEGWAHYQLGNNIEQLESIKKAYHLAPYDFEILSNLGSALIKNYQLTEAEEALLKSYKLNKYHDPTKLNLSVLNYNKQQYWQALQWLKEIPGYGLEHPSLLNKIISKLSFPQV